MNNYAPVFVPTLNRFTHFKRCVESLKKNSLASETILIVALDYPFKKSHWVGYYKIKEYLRTLEGFRDVVKIEREKNFGWFRNSIETLTSIFESYDSVIFTEDDNEFSENYLVYMNECLMRFKGDNSVFAVSGYLYNVNIPEINNNIFKARAMSGWGFGIWKDRWKIFMETINNTDFPIDILNDFNYTIKLFRIRPKSVNWLFILLNNQEIYADVLITIYLLIHDKYCIFPIISKLRNYGMDGSGVHCGISGEENVRQIIDANDGFSIIKEPNFDKKTDKIIQRYFSISKLMKLKIIIKYILFRFNNFKDTASK